MSKEGSFSDWINKLRDGDEEAARQLWDRYFQRMIVLARKKLRGKILRTADEEDVAVSAFKSFWQGVRRNRFSALSDAENLWALLFIITARKAHDYLQYDDCEKRSPGAPEVDAGQAPSREPPPDAAAQLSRDFQDLLDRLEDPVLQSVALWKMEGFTNGEIAAKLSTFRPTVERTVERKLQRIRGIWAEEVTP
jgi:DNA-directed RNA polymerase specialized sigma24 family protein